MLSLHTYPRFQHLHLPTHNIGMTTTEMCLSTTSELTLNPLINSGQKLEKQNEFHIYNTTIYNILTYNFIIIS